MDGLQRYPCLDILYHYLLKCVDQTVFFFAQLLYHHLLVAASL
jgi:hypothetical protein